MLTHCRNEEQRKVDSTVYMRTVPFVSKMDFRFSLEGVTEYIYIYILTVEIKDLKP